MIIGNSILGFSKGIVAFFLVTMSLFHVFFLPKSADLDAEPLQYRKIIVQRDSTKLSHRALLNSGHISIPVFVKRETESDKNFKYLFERQREIKFKLEEEHSFRGRSSFMFWIYLFGLVTLGIYNAIANLVYEFQRGSTFKHQIISLVSISVCFFWLIHLIFFTQNDFQTGVYKLLIFMLAVAFTIPTYFIIKYYSYKDNIINSLLGLLLRNKYIHIPNFASKAMYAEIYDKALEDRTTVEEDLERFDKDYNETIKSVKL